MYVQQIEGDSWRGGKLDKAKLDKMSGTVSKCGRATFTNANMKDEQIVQLYELMQAIKADEGESGDTEKVK
jgi:hypothetical protein